MKKITVTLLAAMFLLACSKKSNPTASRSSGPASGPATPMSENVSQPAAGTESKAGISDLTASGKQIFMAKCDKCHGYKDPANYSRDRWVHIMDKMAVKSNLTDSEKSAVLMYVQANAGK